jgi:hypothetical protein
MGRYHISLFVFVANFVCDDGSILLRSTLIINDCFHYYYSTGDDY